MGDVSLKPLIEIRRRRKRLDEVFETPQQRVKRP